MHKITQIRIFKMWESCERTTYFVELQTDEGFTMTPSSHQTGSVYTNFEGISLEEARDRALMDAHDWADFLGIEVDPYEEDGTVHQPSMKFNRYTIRRELADRKQKKQASA